MMTNPSDGFKPAREMMLNKIKQRLLTDPHGAVNVSRRLLKDYGRHHWRSYAIALVWMACTAACTSISAYIIGSAINEGYASGNFVVVAAIGIAIILLFAGKGVSIYSQQVILAKVSNQIDAENQRRMFDKLLQQNLAYFKDKHSSQFIAQVAYGSGAASNILQILITRLGRDLMTLMGLVVVMLLQAPLLTLIGLTLMAPSIATVMHLKKRVRSIAMSEFKGSMTVAESLQEGIQGLRIVKALNLEEEMRRRVADDTHNIERAANMLARAMNSSTPLMEALGGVALGSIVIYGGYEILVLKQPPGQFVSFIAAFLLAYEPAKRIARMNLDLSHALVGVGVLFDILDLPDRSGDDKKPVLEVKKGRISFEGISFAYPGDRPVLRSTSFTAEPGQITALVGPSGGGKTTIFNLLLRFYDPDEGVVAIDGRHIASFSQNSVRANIAYVGQDIFLFPGTVRTNIAMGRLGASEDEIVAAAKAAYAHDFITALSAGYDTPVGEHGMQLSGGERQRISVARAIIRDVPILLFDEPTSSLDTESEGYVQKTIRRLAEGRTTLVIAHRLNTIQDADVIHFIEEGRVVESGRHDSLLRDGRRYAGFYSSQFRRRPTTTIVHAEASVNSR